MIDLTTGVPGSGKTYYEVNKIYNLITAKEKKYKHIFTNINGLNLKKCNELANELDYVQSFEFMDLKKDIDLEYEYHQKAKQSTGVVPIKTDFKIKTDEEYNQLLDGQKLQYDKQKKQYDENLKLKDDNSEIIQLKENYDDFVKSKGVYALYSDSLIVIDECHLYFEDRADDTLIRFLSYHRHFNIDLDLVTQNKNLINKKYLSFIETMYVAFPASKRFFSKSFRYKKYASYQEYHANIMGNTSLKLTEKIFSLYSSGSNVLSKSIFSKLMLPIALISIFSFTVFYFLTSSLKEDEIEPNKRLDNNVSIIDKRVKNNSVVHENESKENIDTSFFVVDCFTNTCTFKQVDMTFTKKSMFEIIDRFTCKVVVNNVTDVNYYTYILECDNKLNEVLKLFNKKQFGVKHEKNNRSTGSASNIFNR